MIMILKGKKPACHPSLYLSFGTLHIGWVEENASIHKGPMYICYHGAHVARTIGCTAILQKYTIYIITSATYMANAGITVL